LINYQGQISNPDGTVPATADYELSISIHDAETGGSLVWGPQKFNGSSGVGLGLKVPVVQGYFNVLLGPVDTLGRSLGTNFTSDTRYIEIKVGTNSPILPRQRVLSAPYALQASNSQKLAGSDWSAIFGANNPSGPIPSSKLADASIPVAKLAQEVVSQLVPIGSVVAFAGDASQVPPGWLLCDGRSITRTQPYQALYDFVGTKWGSAGLNTRLIPDFRGLFLRGVDDSPLRGPAQRDLERDARVPLQAGGQGGNNVGSFQPGQVQPHHHHVVDWPVNQTYEIQPAGNTGLFAVGFGPIATIENAPPTGANQGVETRPINVYVNYIIKF
jgi:microcystin-dependent protein